MRPSAADRGQMLGEIRASPAPGSSESCLTPRRPPDAIQTNLCVFRPNLHSFMGRLQVDSASPAAVGSRPLPLKEETRSNSPGAGAPVAGTPPRGNRWHDVGIAAALVLLVAVVFGRSVAFDFVNLDDYAYIVLNDPVTEGLTAKNAWWALTTFHFCNWHPVTYWSWQVDASIGGGFNPAGYHVTSVLLHAVNAVLVFLMLRRLTGRRLDAFLGAIVFAIHPLRWESVGWISERKDLTSTLFAMLAVLSYDRYARGPGWRQMVVVTFWFALSLMSKGMAVTLPCVLILLDWRPYGRWTSVRDLPRLVLEKWPLWILAAASSVVTVLAQREGDAIRTMAEVSFPDRLVGAIWAYTVYIGQTFWPAKLAVLYPIVPSRPVWQWLACLLVLGGITAAAWLVRRRWPAVLVGWLCYLGMLVPVIGLVQVGVQAHADRYTYLPGIPLIAALGTLVVEGARRWCPPAARWPMAVLALLALTVASVRHGGVWRSSFDLWSQAVYAAPSERNWWEYGSSALRASRYEEAIAGFQEACRLAPETAENHVGLATAYAGAKRWDDAEPVARRALALCEGQSDEPELEAGSRYVLAKVAMRRGEQEEAARQFRDALRLTAIPNVASESAVALVRLGHADEAIPHLRKAVEEKPEDRDRHGILADAYLHAGDWAAAAVEFEQGVTLAPGEPRMRSRWATSLLAAGQTEPARAEARIVLQQDPGWPNKGLRAAMGMVLGPATKASSIAEGYWLAATIALVFDPSPPPAEVLDVMAMGAAGLGRFDEAERLAGEAIQAARAAGREDLATAIAGRQELYRKGERPKAPEPAARPAGDK